MQTDDTILTKIPKRVLKKTPKGLKHKCKTLKVGQALPVSTIGWAANLKTQLNESTDLQFDYWSEPQVSAHKYRQMSEAQRKSVKVFIGRIA